MAAPSNWSGARCNPKEGKRSTIATEDVQRTEHAEMRGQPPRASRKTMARSHERAERRSEFGRGLTEQGVAMALVEPQPGLAPCFRRSLETRVVAPLCTRTRSLHHKQIAARCCVVPCVRSTEFGWHIAHSDSLLYPRQLTSRKNSWGMAVDSIRGRANLERCMQSA